MGPEQASFASNSGVVNETTGPEQASFASNSGVFNATMGPEQASFASNSGVFNATMGPEQASFASNSGVFNATIGPHFHAKQGSTHAYSQTGSWQCSSFQGMFTAQLWNQRKHIYKNRLNSEIKEIIYKNILIHYFYDSRVEL
jgi:hypothetical protein